MLRVRQRTLATITGVSLAVAGRGSAAIAIDVTLDPALDVIGQQVIAVQAYTPTGGGQSVIDLVLFDIGASVISFSWYGNQHFPLPHLNAGGAGGLQDFSLNFDSDTFEFSGGIATPIDRSVAGIQAFVGTETGSPNLPSLTGTPIHGPSGVFPGG